MDKHTIFGFVGASFGSLISFMYGENIEVLNALKFLTFFMIFNFLTGYIKAINNKNIQSEVMGKGFIKKIVYLLFVSFAHLCDNFIGTKSNQLVLLSISAFSFLEGHSIIENFILLGVDVPDEIKKYFVKDGEEDGK